MTTLQIDLTGSWEKQRNNSVLIPPWQKRSNEWYPRGLQISLHIRSPGLQDNSEVWNLKFFRLGGGWGILGHSDLDYDNFHWGGILEHSDLDSDNFHLGGYSGTLGFELSGNFHFGGVFWDTRIWTLWQFSFGGVFCTKLLQNRGILWDLDQNFNHSSRLMHHR